VAHSPAGWQIAVVVLRYFIAVLMGASGYEPLGECISAIVVLVGPVGLEPTRQSMTQDVYMGRKVLVALVAEALGMRWGKTTPGEGPAKKSE